MEKPFTRGRWYRFFVESDGTTATLTGKDDIDASIIDNNLVLPKGFTLATCFNELHTIEANEANVCRILYDTDGLTKVELPIKNFDHGYIYIRGFFN